MIIVNELMNDVLSDDYFTFQIVEFKIQELRMTSLYYYLNGLIKDVKLKKMNIHVQTVLVQK